MTASFHWLLAGNNRGDSQKSGTHFEACTMESGQIDFNLNSISGTNQSDHSTDPREAVVFADGEEGRSA